MIVQLSVIVFITQFVFIFCRTWNVKSIAKNNIKQVLLSGSFVHFTWLISISINTISMAKMITEFKTEYLPVIFSSLIGGLLGSYLSMKIKQKESNTL